MPSGEYTELGLEQTTYSWHDGLVQEQAGMDSMRSLFNVNYFVVSQTNVYITMLLTLKHRVAALGPLYLKLADAWEVRVRLPYPPMNLRYPRQT